MSCRPAKVLLHLDGVGVGWKAFAWMGCHDRRLYNITADEPSCSILYFDCFHLLN